MSNSLEFIFEDDQNINDENTSFLNISTDLNIFNNDYYNIFLGEVDKLSKIRNKPKNKVWDDLSLYLKRMNNIIKNQKDDISEQISSVLNILFYPIYNKMFYNKNKTYDDFNIDLDFFSFINDTEDRLFSVLNFEFNTKNKLKKFTIKNLDSGIKYNYNSNYKVTEIIFSDGESLKIPKKYQ